MWLSTCKSPTCWTSHLTGAEFNFLTLTCTTNKPSLSVHQVSWQGPLSHRSTHPIDPTAANIQKKLGTCFVLTFFIELNLSRINCTPCPPPLHIYCCTSMDLKWHDQRARIFPNLLSKSKAMGLCKWPMSSFWSFAHPNAIKCCQNSLTYSKLGPFGSTGVRYVQCPKNKIWWGDQKSTSARQLKKKPQTQTEQLPATATVEIVELCCDQIGSHKGETMREPIHHSLPKVQGGNQELH